MRKSTIAGLGLVLALGSVNAASAQQPRAERQRPDSGEMRRGPRGHRGGPDAMLLKGITLSTEQQARLTTLREQQRSQMQNGREQHEQVRAEIRAARERGDTAAVNTRMRALRQQMEQSHERHVAALRGILTSSQVAQFDANVAEWNKRRAERPERGGKERGERRPPRGDRSEA